MGIDLSGMTITSKVGEIHDNGVGVQVNVSDKSAAPDDNAEILRELQSVREQLAKTEPMIAKAVGDLEKAVKAKDKPAIAEQLANFASGAAKGVIAGVASKALLSWMGIS